MTSDDIEFYRFVQSVSRRYGISIDQVVWIARNLCDRDILCDYLGLRVKESDDIPPVRVGIARVVVRSCSCGCLVECLQGASDPHHIMMIEDVIPVLGDDHHSSEHMDKPDDNTQMVRGLTKVNVLGFIEPNDLRYSNRLRWARGIINGKVMYVRADGLRNTVY